MYLGFPTATSTCSLCHIRNERQDDGGRWLIIIIAPAAASAASTASINRGCFCSARSRSHLLYICFLAGFARVVLVGLPSQIVPGPHGTQNAVASKGHGIEIVESVDGAQLGIDTGNSIVLQLNRKTGQSRQVVGGEDAFDGVVRQVDDDLVVRWRSRQ